MPGLALKGGLLFASPNDRLAHKRDLNNFQPRVGVAWHALKNTVFRGGYGMSYVPTFAPGGTQGFTGSTPIVGTTDGGLTPATHLFNPFPDGLLRPTGSSSGLSTFVGQAVIGQQLHAHRRDSLEIGGGGDRVNINLGTSAGGEHRRIRLPRQG